VRDLDPANDDHLPGVSSEVKAHLRRISRPIVYPIQGTVSQTDVENAAAFDELENRNKLVFYSLLFFNFSPWQLSSIF
jgi:hypothetical protein